LAHDAAFGTALAEPVCPPLRAHRQALVPAREPPLNAALCAAFGKTHEATFSPALCPSFAPAYGATHGSAICDSNAAYEPTHGAAVDAAHNEAQWTAF